MNCIVKGAHIVGLFVLLLYAPAAISYDYSCSRDARNLKYAADNYESALSEYESAKSSYESAKSSYESACASGWGYSQNDESAVERMDTNEQVSNLLGTISNLLGTISNLLHPTSTMLCNE